MTVAPAAAHVSVENIILLTSLLFGGRLPLNASSIGGRAHIT